MATNVTCSSEQLLNSIEEYASTLHPACTFHLLGSHSLRLIVPPDLDLLTNTVFASLMIPFLLSLFYFSTAHRRRSPMFVLVVLSVLLALVQYVYEMALRVCLLFHSSVPFSCLARF
jgi:hypothetical protein